MRCWVRLPQGIRFRLAFTCQTLLPRLYSPGTRGLDAIVALPTRVLRVRLLFHLIFSLPLVQPTPFPCNHRRTTYRIRARKSTTWPRCRSALHCMIHNDPIASSADTSTGPYQSSRTSWASGSRLTTRSSQSSPRCGSAIDLAKVLKSTSPSFRRSLCSLLRKSSSRASKSQPHGPRSGAQPSDTTKADAHQWTISRTATLL